jgi:hypothetical protein
MELDGYEEFKENMEIWIKEEFEDYMDRVKISIEENLDPKPYELAKIFDSFYDTADFF